MLWLGRFKYTVIVLGVLFWSGLFVLYAQAEEPSVPFTEITEDIIENTVWTKAESPYVIRTRFRIPREVTLTIEPGVVVKFDLEADIFTEGRIEAEGSASEPIYFTSFYDDEIADTDNETLCDLDEEGNDLPDTCESYDWGDPFPDDWDGLAFNNSNSIFKNVFIKYADDAIRAWGGSSLDFENLSITDSLSGLTAYQNSEVGIVGGVLDNLNKDAIVVFNDTSFTGSNIEITNIVGEAVTVFNDSTFTIGNVHFSDIFGAPVTVFNDSVLSAEGLKIENIFYDDEAIVIFNNVELNLTNSSLSGCPSGACITFFDGATHLSKPSKLNIQKTIFDGGSGSGLLAFGDSHISVTVKDSSFSGFAYLAIENYADFTIQAENNWWGDASGPYQETGNPGGIGESIYGNATFTPWCGNEECHVRNPVIIIPGIMGTEIFKNYGDTAKIWADISILIFSTKDEFMNDLALNTDGTEDGAKPMRIGDIIRETAGGDIFAGLIDTLTLGGYVENTDMFVFPYDWRKSNTDNQVLLKNKIDEILGENVEGKVNIVAHSMGGLLAKKYIADNGPDKVDNLIFIGTPHLGAPKAFKALMYGDDMGIRVGASILSPQRVKYISQNMPGVFELLPSKKYVDGAEGFIGTKYVTDLTKEYILAPGSTPDLNYEKTKNLMIKEGRNGGMFPFAEDLHASTDDLDLSGVNITNFAGCGLTKTIGGIIAKKKKSTTSEGQKIEDAFQLKYTNGDETVPMLSSAISYGTKYYVKDYKHSSLPSLVGVKETVLAILGGATLGDYDTVSRDINDCYLEGDSISVHSPVELHIYDEEGRHTGPDENGDIEYEIPGVSYEVIGDEKFAFLPTGGNYRVVNKAQDTGTYDFYLEHIDGDDTKTSQTYWNEIPLNTLQTISEILINLSVADYVVKVDEEGDGIYEKEIAPSSVLDGEEASDLTPPETSNFYTEGKISLSAVDDNSGVLKTEYSLGGDKWLVYGGPIEGAGKMLQYFSTDKAGNIETVNSLEIPAFSRGTTSGSLKKLFDNIDTVFSIPTQSNIGLTLPKEDTKEDTREGGNEADVDEGEVLGVENFSPEIEREPEENTPLAPEEERDTRIDYATMFISMVGVAGIVFVAKKFIKI